MDRVKDLNLAIGWRDRKYGQVSGSTLEILFSQIKDAWASRNEVRDLVQTLAPEKLFSRFVDAPPWWELYSLSYAEFAVCQASAMGILDEVMDAAGSDSPTDDFVSRSTRPSFFKDAPDTPDPLGLAVALVMQTNAEAIAHYSLSMHQLVARISASPSGLLALRRAAGIDVSVFGMPQVVALLRSLQLSRDSAKLLHDVVVSPTKKPHGNIKYRELRWMDFILRDREVYGACTDVEIHDLLVNRLHMYPDDSEVDDSFGALIKLLQKWHREVEN